MIFLSYHTEVLPRVRMMGRVKYQEPWKHFLRKTDEYVLYVIREGDMYLVEDGIQYHLQAGDLFLLEPNLIHEGYQEAVCDYYYIHFKHDGLRRADMDQETVFAEMQEKRRRSMISYNLDEAPVTDPITYIPKKHAISIKDYRQIFREAIEIYNAREEHYKRRVSANIHCFFMNFSHEFLLEQIGEHSTSGTRRSEKIAEELILYLNENYTQKHNSAEIEERFELNYDYLNRVFQRITGSTIFAYILSVRINHAKHLIETTNLAFSEIAYLVGIDDKFYFSKIFKKYVGCTPTEYYRTHHKQEEGHIEQVYSYSD